jgi:hypothetical protein
LPEAMNLSRMVTIVHAASGGTSATLVYRRRRGSIDLSPPLFASLIPRFGFGRTAPEEPGGTELIAWGPEWRGVMAHAQAEADRLRGSAAEALEGMGRELAALYLADCAGLFAEPQGEPCECGGSGVVWESLYVPELVTAGRVDVAAGWQRAAVPCAVCGRVLAEVTL